MRSKSWISYGIFIFSLLTKGLPFYLALTYGFAMAALFHDVVLGVFFIPRKQESLLLQVLLQHPLSKNQSQIPFFSVFNLSLICVLELYV